MPNELKAYKILQKKGFTDQEAQDFLDAIKNDVTTFATKGDIKLLQSDINTKFAEINADINTKFAEINAKLHEELNKQTNRFLAILVTVGTVLGLLSKGFDVIVSRWH